VVMCLDNSRSLKNPALQLTVPNRPLRGADDNVWEAVDSQRGAGLPPAQWVQTRVLSGTECMGQEGWNRPVKPHFLCTKSFLMFICWCS